MPVLAIITKFDVFVQDVLQELEEAAEAEGNEIDDELFEEKAKQTAKERFDLYYKIPLKELPYPPKTVLALSESLLPFSCSLNNMLILAGRQLTSQLRMIVAWRL